MAGEFQVGEWLIEPTLNRIKKGDRTVQVEPKVLEVLVFLAQHPAEVLSKPEILAAVWSGTFVTEDALSYSIWELRRAFGDDARNPQYIQTISRKGYRLIAAVKRREQESKTQLSIAILPFSNMSADKDQEYFCDGMTEEVINNLVRLKELRVVSRTSVFAFKGKSEDVRSIGRRLGVTTVLEGSVRKAENHLRIAAQLINVSDGCHVWSGQFDRELKDAFAIQDEIARNIASALSITLSEKDRDAFAKAPTRDLQAYEYYLRGKQYYYQYRRKGIEYARRMFSQALELDPGFARAHAGLADCCAFLYLYAGSDPSYRAQADSASLKALEIDPESAEAHASRGVALSLSGGYVQAEACFENATRLDPWLFEAYYFHARMMFAQGNLEKAARLYEKASEVHPRDYQSPLLVAQSYADLGMPAEAESCPRRGIQLVEARLSLHPDDARALYMGANGLVALGERERGLEWARQALAIDPDEPMVLYNVACIQALAGCVEEAMESLEQAVRKGLTERGWIEHDSNLLPVRSHPRYPSLIKLLDDAERTGLAHTDSEAPPGESQRHPTGERR